MATFYLTALRQSPQKHEDLPVPRVATLDTTAVVKAITVLDDDGKERTVVKYAKERYQSTIYAAEKLGQYFLQTDFNNAASSPYNTGTKQSLAACGSGTAQAASATPVTAYFNTVTAATATTMVGVKLPNASTSGLLGTALVIRNGASTAITVVPAASEILDSTTAGIKSIPVNHFMHFYCSATNKWVTCKGPYN